MANKIKSQSTEMLLEIVETLINNYEADETIVYMAVLDELEARLPKKEFLELCETINA